MQILLEEGIGSQGRSEGWAGPVYSSPSVFSRMRHKIRPRWPEWATLSLYAALVAFAIPYHEAWSSEAQAWQLARTLSLHDLLLKYVRYEGAPCLWHVLLWVLIRAHVSYSGVHWVCGAIATVGTSLLVFRSPFPRYLKLTLPFTYFLLFHYAVIARTYALVPLLLYLVALCWKRRPILLALLLGLLANVALHTAAISGGLAVVYAIVQLRQGAARNPKLKHELVLSAIIVLSAYAFVFWTTWPAPNHSYMRGESHSFVVNAIISIVWGICQPWILSIPFWIAIALCLHARRSAIFLLPVLFFVLFSAAVHVAFWHSGLLVPLLICLLWITWPAPGRLYRYEILGHAALLFLVGVQIVWSAYALDYDHYHAYAPSQAAAEFLKPLVRQGATVAVTSIDGNMGNNFESVGILPYFDHNIYVNQPQAFWWWSTSNPTEHLFDVALRSHPPSIVVVETTRNHPDDPIDLNFPRIKLLTQNGYMFTNLFCGAKPQRLQLVPGTCHLIFQRSAAPQDSRAKTNNPAAVTGPESDSRPSLPNSLPIKP